MLNFIKDTYNANDLRSEFSTTFQVYINIFEFIVIITNK